MMQVHMATGQHGTNPKRKHKGEFELPEDISEDDEMLLTSILSVLCSLDVCTAYSIQPCMQNTCFMIRGTLENETFEVGSDELHLIQMANPLRIERVAIGRCEGCNQLLVKVLNSKQRVMALSDDSVFFVCSRKRKLAKIAQAPK
jgi:hypothetical protein